MVDLHCHVLYGLDDGPRDLDSSVAMLRMAADNGTTDIVATPHANLKYSFKPDVIESRLGELYNIAGVPRLHRGCDLHLSFDNLKDCFEYPSKYSINGKGYLLVEFADRFIPTEIEDVFRHMLAAGMTPVITHPERNPILSKRTWQLKKWVAAGCRVQITAQSILGRFGRLAEQSARNLLEANLVHFVASDAHNSKDRPPNLRPAFEEMEREYGKETARRLFVTNPASALDGEQILDINEGVTKRHGWFKLW